MIDWLYVVMTIFAQRNGSIFAIRNLRGMRHLSRSWLRAWQHWLMAKWFCCNCKPVEA